MGRGLDATQGPGRSARMTEVGHLNPERLERTTERERSERSERFERFERFGVPPAGWQAMHQNL
jgi:hypothetical protein